MVGQPALVGLFPGFAQLTQGLLHLAPAQGGRLVRAQQRLRPAQQFLAQLVGAPALPAFQLARSSQGLMDPCIQGRIEMAAMALEHITQGAGRAGTGFAMAFGHFLLQGLEFVLDQPGGLLAKSLTLGGIDPWLGRFGDCRHRLGGRLPPQRADFFGPDRHRRQGRVGLSRRCIGLLEGGVKSAPDGLQLAA